MTDTETLTTTDRLPRVPDGKRIYVIGDIHGRNDLLARLHTMIVGDVLVRPRRSGVVVYLGDYVDRGFGSFEVIEMLTDKPLAGFERVCLMGNHEDMMLRFIEGSPGANWLFNGGVETLLSYGIELSSPYFDPVGLKQLSNELASAMPRSHLEFLQNLRLSHSEQDYLFVHAGVRPGVPLDAQEPRDMIWIRNSFLASDEDFGKRIVHGHSISPTPEVLANRIGIDTGAFYTGRLTCLVLEGSEHRFLHT